MNGSCCKEREGRVSLGQVDGEVNTVALRLVAMTALSPPQGLRLCVCVYMWGGRGVRVHAHLCLCGCVCVKES